MITVNWLQKGTSLINLCIFFVDVSNDNIFAEDEFKISAREM